MERKKRRRQIRKNFILLFGVSVFLVLTVWFGGRKFFAWTHRQELLKSENASFIGAPPFEVDLLDINEYSRPGIPLEKINGIVVHYTANPGSTAQNNRDYFNGLKDSHETEASSNFIVGLDGEIIQCVPTWEMAYASNSRNIDTVSIECCHPDETGKFTDETYRSLVQLTAWLCVKFNLTEDQVIRHYDVTGKNCPKYFVENEEAWDQFKKDVAGAIAKGS